MIPVTRSAIYLDGIFVSFDGFKALNNLSVELAAGELRAVIWSKWRREINHDGRDDWENTT